MALGHDRPGGDRAASGPPPRCSRCQAAPTGAATSTTATRPPALVPVGDRRDRRRADRRARLRRRRHLLGAARRDRDQRAGRPAVLPGLPGDVAGLVCSYKCSASTSGSGSRTPRPPSRAAEQPTLLRAVCSAAERARRDASSSERFDVAGHRRRHHRRRGGAGRGLARLQRGAGGAGRLRVGHEQPLLQAGARRSALPAELRPGAGPRGPARAPAHGPRSPPISSVRCRSSCRPLTGPALTGWSGIGLNMYDVMAARRRCAGAASARRARGGRTADSGLEPGAPPAHLRRGGARAAPRARAPRARPAAICSTTARPTTSASCSPCWARPSASARSAPTASRSPSCAPEAPDGRRGRATTARRATSFAVRADNVVNATGVWADRIRARGAARRGRGARGSRPAAAPTSPAPRGPAAASAGAIVPAGEGRSIFALPWLGRTPDRHHRQQLHGDDRSRPPVGRGHRLPARRDQRLLRHLAGPGHLTGAYAGVRPLISSGDSRKSVDISRKAELYETSSGLITITGGKLTTWRRMAQAGRRPDRRARRPPGAVPHAGDPARRAGRAGGAGARRGRRRRRLRALAGRYGHAAARRARRPRRRAR